MNTLAQRIGRHDVVYPEPPGCWQDGFLLGNGALGALYFAPAALEWIVNKTDVIDGRTIPVRRLIPPEQARRMVRHGATVGDFRQAELPDPPPMGIGPKSCCRLAMELGYSDFGAGHPALPAITSRLGLADGTVRVAVDKHLFHPRVESFVDAHANLLAIRVRDVSPLANHNTRLIFSRPEDVQLGAPTLRLERGRILMTMNLPAAGHYVAGLQVVPQRGTVYRKPMRAHMRRHCWAPDRGTAHCSLQGRFGIIHVGGDFDVFISVASTRDATDPRAEVHRLLDRAVRDGFAKRQRAHAKWWAGYWSRSRVALPDKTLEREFYRSLYMLGATYRAGRKPIAGLCGLAYGPDIGPIQVTPWSGDLHHDLNIECPFFPVFALNHGDLADAYLDAYRSFLPEARRLARQVWRARGAHFDMAFTGLGKSMFGGVGTYRFFFGGSYLAMIHCLAWRFQRDRHQLQERIYPFLKEILAFYLDIARRDRSGTYHFDPAHAPELDIASTSDPVQLVSMLKICLRTAIEASALLRRDPRECARWQNLLAHLPAYPTGTDQRGRQVVVDAVNVPADHHLAQAACLYPIYPCSEIDEFTDRTSRALYEATFNSAVEKIAYHSFGIEHGSFLIGAHPIFFTGMTALRLGRVEEFWRKWLPMLVRGCAKPNGLMSHIATIVVDPARSEKNLANIPAETLGDVGARMPKWEAWHGHQGYSTPNPRAKRLSEPLIEANADFLTMLTETLLQSHNGLIRVFPALPRAWRDVSFQDFRAEGAFLVSATMRRGKLREVRLRSERGGVARLRHPWRQGILTFTMKPGQTICLTPPGKSLAATAGVCRP